jgi:phage gp29-like protein
MFAQPPTAPVREVTPSTPPNRTQPNLPGAPARLTPEPLEVTDEEKGLEFIVPQARDRWLAGETRWYTPHKIENILRGALSGTLLYQWQLFDLMESTWPRLAQKSNELKRAAIRLNWTVRPYSQRGDKVSPEAQERRDYIEEALFSMEDRPDTDQDGWEGTLYNILDAWGKGIALQEIFYETAPLPSGGPAVLRPKYTRWVHPRMYGYPPQSNQLMLATTEAGFVNLPNAALGTSDGVGKWIPLVKDKFLVSIVKMKSGHPIGGALLRELAWWWIATQFTQEWFLNFAQTFGQPIRWATYDPSRRGLQSTLSDMLECMGSSAWAAFPEGTKLEILESAKSAGDSAHMVLLKYADQLVDIRFMGQTLTTNTGESGGGSLALGKVHQGVKGEVIMDAGGVIKRVVNGQLIPAMLRAAYGDTQWAPSLVSEEEDDQAGLLKVQKFQAVLQSGVPIPRRFYYDSTGIPMPDAGEDVISGAPSSPGAGAAAVKPPKPGGAAADETPEDGGTPADGETVNAKGANSQSTAPIEGDDAQAKLLDNVLEKLTGVQARWLGGVKPYFAHLIFAAQDTQNISDAEFVHTLQRAKGHFPELFGNLDARHLQTALENAMASSVVNGVSQAEMRQAAKRNARKKK